MINIIRACCVLTPKNFFVPLLVLVKFNFIAILFPYIIPNVIIISVILSGLVHTALTLHLGFAIWQTNAIIARE